MYKRVLVAFDGSEPSRHALDHAVNIATMFSAELTILSVVPKVQMPMFPDGGPAPIIAPNVVGYQDKLREVYAKSLRDVEKDVKDAYPELKVSSTLLEGRPSSTIVEKAESDEADLIVIGSRGVGGITGWLLGSTSRRVVESCTKPVLVIKTP